MLSDFSRGIISARNPVDLEPGWLADSYGFEVNSEGKLITEPRLLSFASTGLPTEYKIRGFTNYQVPWPVSGAMQGYYYLAFISTVTAEPFEIWRTAKWPISWSKVTGRTSNYSGYWSFARLVNKLYVINNANGLIDLDTPATNITTDGGNPIWGEYLITHQDRLFTFSTMRIKWSPVLFTGASGQWRDIDYTDAPIDKDGEGIQILYPWSPDVLLVMKPNESYRLLGYPFENQFLPLTPGNPNFGVISPTSVHASRAGGPIYFLSPDNAIYEFDGQNATDVSMQIDRKRDISRTIFTPMADFLEDHYRLQPVAESATATTAERHAYTSAGPAQERTNFTNAEAGWSLNVRRRAWTRSAQWTGIDAAGITDTGQYAWASIWDPVFKRILRIASKPSGDSTHDLSYMDMASLPSARIYAGSTTHFFIIGDFAPSADPTKVFGLREIHFSATPTTSAGTTYCTIEVRFDSDGLPTSGTWLPVYKADLADTASATTFPVDGLEHRGGLNTYRNWHRIGIRLSFSNAGGPGAGQGMMVNYVKLLYYEQDTAKW